MNVIKFIISFIWGLPLNILALICIFFLGTEFPFKWRDGVFVAGMSYEGGITLGNFIFLNYGLLDREDYYKHEHGHVKQSYILGPLYLLLIGLPSLIWASLHKYIAPNKDYESFYTEKWLM